MAATPEASAELPELDVILRESVSLLLAGGVKPEAIFYAWGAPKAALIPLSIDDPMIPEWTRHPTAFSVAS